MDLSEGSHIYATSVIITPFNEEVFLNFSVTYPIVDAVKNDNETIILSLSKFKEFTSICLNTLKSIEGQYGEIKPSETSQAMLRKFAENIQKKREDNGPKDYFG